MADVTTYPTPLDDSWKLITITATSQADGDEFDPGWGGGGVTPKFPFDMVCTICP